MLDQSVFWAALWGMVANCGALLPSRDHHWRFAYALIAMGLPILVWVWWQHGWLLALVILVAAMSILRWPVIFLTRWARRQIGI